MITQEEAKEKSQQLYDEYFHHVFNDDSEASIGFDINDHIKHISLVSIEKEYKSNRELLFNLRSCGVIENEKVYLSRLQDLIDEEIVIKNEIDKL